jgi:putative RecB family exonuclease
VRRSSSSSTGRSAVPEQLGFPGMPQRLFVCTPSKLGSYADCPRRYRYSYVDRPTPPKGPPWAHNSLGASVHTAMKNWFGLPADRRRPEALGTLLKATWVREGYRDVEQERAAWRTALSWLEGYVSGLDPAFEPVGVERVVAARTAVLALSGRADRIDSRVLPDGRRELVIVDYKTGRSGSDPDEARGSQALALYAYAAEKVFHQPCHRVELHHLPTGAVAAHEHTDDSLARQIRRAEDTAQDIMAAEQAVTDGADPDAAFPTTPGRLCSWCDFRAVCPAGATAEPKEPWSAMESTLRTDPAPRPREGDQG